jgi:Na+/phosphate symporter
MRDKKYRVGRKQNRVIISEDGIEEVAFVKGSEHLAKLVVDILNSNNHPLESIVVIDKEKLKEMVKQLSFGADNTKWIEERFGITL